MTKSMNREHLLAALARIGEAAVANAVTIELLVYGGSALMLASNFRFSSEDVDIAELEKPWPRWLEQVVVDIAAERGWAFDWLSEAVSFHLSPLASAADHLEVGTFPEAGREGGLRVFVPTAEYMLALKIKAIRVNDPAKGRQETADILNLVKLLGLESPDDALRVMARFFPRTAASPEKHQFLLKHIWQKDISDAPVYLGRGG